MGRTTETARLPRGGLSPEDVIGTAMSIADREGLAALTMRRLAADLGVGVMTLYGYVRTKEELIERVAEAAIAELEIPHEGDGSWDQRVERLFTNLRELLWRHPSVLYADVQRPLIGPGALRALDAALEMLRSAGLDRKQAVTAMSTLVSYTFGSAMFRLNHSGEWRPDYEREVRAASKRELPQVAHHSQALLSRGGDQEFFAGLRLIIDGLARQAAGRSSDERPD